MRYEAFLVEHNAASIRNHQDPFAGLLAGKLNNNSNAHPYSICDRNRPQLQYSGRLRHAPGS